MHMKPIRKANRLFGYDYSQLGYYFVTICTQNRACHFGEINREHLVLSDAGIVVKKYWQSIPQYYPGVQLDEFIVMPNHVHGIITVGAINNRPQHETDGLQHDINRLKNGTECSQDETKRAVDNRPYGLLSQIIKSFKQITTKQIRSNIPDFAWQRSFYDHIVRNDGDLHRIRLYIVNTPQQWHLGKENLNGWGEG